MKSRIVDRKIRVGFHNGHTLVLPERNHWVEASLIESDDDEDILILPADLARYVPAA